jgi:GTP-binding protein HflX
MAQPKFELTNISDTAVDRAILVGIDLGRRQWGLEESLAELARLVDTAGAEIVGTVTQRLDRPSPKTFIGAGKAEEVTRLARKENATLVVFDDDLTPSQQANVEDLIPDVKILDRTALILDIFALHATSTEGKLQVELAQMEYLLPRLKGLWRHFGQAAAAAGGAKGIGTRGPGETQLETDRRLARGRVQKLKRDLKRVSANRQLQRHARADSGIYRVSLVGYTNAGKSTLLNRLTDADVVAEDKLFATLDSVTRRLDLEDGRVVTMTDTVGFIHKLPHGLVEAFKSTLDEVVQADLLLHVVDSSHPQLKEQMQAVTEVLGEIEASDKPQLLVFNKIDAADPQDVERLKTRYPAAAFCSALTGDGIGDVRRHIATEAARGSRKMRLLVPYERGDLVRLAHENGQILSEEHTGSGTLMQVRLPVRIADRFAPYSHEGGA